MENPEEILVPEDGVADEHMLPAAILPVEVHSDSEAEPDPLKQETEPSTKPSRDDVIECESNCDCVGNVIG